jgi:hypothetical protein
MLTSHLHFLFFVVIAWFMSSCSQEGMPTNFTENLGSLKLTLQVNQQMKNARQLAADISQFSVTFYTAANDVAVHYDALADMPASLSLPVGEYYVVAHSNNLKTAAFESPYYRGQSGLFSIENGQERAVNLECNIANSKVSLNYTENTRQNYTNITTTLSTVDTSLLLDVNESRSVFFASGQDISVEARMNYEENGQTKEHVLFGKIPSPLPRHHYQLTINADAADQGRAGLAITVNDSLVVNELVVEDQPVKTIDELVPHDIIVTEIMANPDALSDSEGEWLEIHNPGSQAIDMQGITINIPPSSYTFDSSFLLYGNGYLVLANSENAVPVVDIVMSTGLNNSGDIITIAGNETISTVDYSTFTIPPAGVALSLDRSSYVNYQQGIYWCEATAIYNTGDYGTPGEVNSSCQ